MIPPRRRRSNLIGKTTISLLGFLLLWAFPLSAGTNGIHQAVVRGKETHEPLPGVNVSIVGLQRGAVTDEEGRFEIQNIRAGHYDVRVTHVSYRASILKNVIIQPDLRTRLSTSFVTSASSQQGAQYDIWPPSPR